MADNITIAPSTEPGAVAYALDDVGGVLLLLSRKSSGPVGPTYRTQSDDMHVFIGGKTLYVTHRQDAVTFLKRAK